MKSLKFIFATGLLCCSFTITTASADETAVGTKQNKKVVKDQTTDFAADYRARQKREGSQIDRDCSCRGQANCSCAPSFNSCAYGNCYGYGYGHGWGGYGSPGWSRGNGWYGGGSDIPTAGYSAPVGK